MTSNAPIPKQFYLTAPTECPYLPDRAEQKIFTHLSGKQAAEVNNALAKFGFRRSQSLVYRPECDGCSACVSVRVNADQFEPDRNQRRILRRNIDVQSHELPPLARSDHFELFQRYLNARHEEGGMIDMFYEDYSLMVEDTLVDTQLIEYVLTLDDGSTQTIGVSLTDQLDDGPSMVYSFFDPEFSNRSLGKFMILDHIRRAAEFDYPYVYLGYWVSGSQKMGYKAQFEPMEMLSESDRWISLSHHHKGGNRG